MDKFKPRFIYQTYGGVLYSLTPENQKGLNIQSLSFVIGDMFRMKDVFEKLPASLSVKQFYGFAEKNLFVTPIAYGQNRSRGCDDKEGIEIDCFGFKKLKNIDYLKLCQSINPDVIVSLSEQPRTDSAGKKTLRRNVQKSKVFLKETIQFKKDNQLNNSIYGAFNGGYDMEIRKESLENLIKQEKDIDGIVIYGLYDDCYTNSNKDNISRSIIFDMIKDSLPNHTISLNSDGEFIKVLEGWYHGVSLFEASFPFDLSRKGKASLISKKSWSDKITHLNKINYDVKVTEVKEIFQRQDTTKAIDLYKECFEKDLTPISIGCECYTCKNFTKAYINHLLRHKEMLANVLLTIHNCYVYSEFFDVIGDENNQQVKERVIKSFWIEFTDAYMIKT